MKIYVILLTSSYDGGMYPEDSYEHTSAEGHAFYSEEAAKAYCEKENAEYAKPVSEFDEDAARAEYKEHLANLSGEDLIEFKEAFPKGEIDYLYTMESAHYAGHNDSYTTYEAHYKEVDLN